MSLSDLVYASIAKIPKGQVLTYKELATKAGNPKAIRAVATIVGKNPNPIVVPCHRVIRSDYHVGEYTYKGKRDKAMKVKLLIEEGITVVNEKVVI